MINYVRDDLHQFELKAFFCTEKARKDGDRFALTDVHILLRCSFWVRELIKALCWFDYCFQLIE
jgi:hypothetical protein